MEGAEMDMDIDSVEKQDFGTDLLHGGRIGRDHLMSILDGIDREVEGLRKHAKKLQEKRDELNTRIDMLRTDFLIPKIDDMDQEEMHFHLKRVNDRLQTVNINVHTIRDDSQVESVHVINNLIDEVIKFGDPIEKRKKCQQYLNSCSSSETAFSEEGSSTVLIDKKFEIHLLSCNLDDQKLIRKRLEALMMYMMKQMVSE
ncbi:BAG family molecular chaperone regulator 2 isoform X2 [Chironomus tepperi]